MVLNSIGGRDESSLMLRIFVLLVAFTPTTLISPVSATLVSFRGYVFIDNESAPEETPVAVYASNGTLLQQREVFIINGNAYYILDVDAPENVFFKVAGVESLEGIVSVDEGGLMRLNLSINALPLGSPCNYDMACASGICCNGVCSESCETTTTTIPSGGGGGGGTGGGAGGGGWSGSSNINVASCESDYSIDVPPIFEGRVNDIITVPVTINVEKVTCPPLTISIILDAPKGWEDESEIVDGLEEGEKRTVKFYIKIPNVSKGVYTFKLKAGNEIKYFDVTVTEETKSTNFTRSNKTEVGIVEEKGRRTGFVTALKKEPLTLIGIVICIVVLVLLYKKARKSE